MVCVLQNLKAEFNCTINSTKDVKHPWLPKTQIRKYSTVIWTISLSKFWLHCVLHISKELSWLLTHFEAYTRSETMCNRKFKLNFDPCLGLSHLVEKFIFIISNSIQLAQAPPTVQTLHDFQLLPGCNWGLHFSGMLLLINAVQQPRTIKEEKDNHVITQVRKWKALNKIMNIHPWNLSIKYLSCFDNGHRKNILYGYKEYIMKSVQFKNYKPTFTVVQNIHPHRKVKSNVLHFLYRGMKLENSFIQQKLVYQIIKLLNAINSDIQLGHSAYLYTIFMKHKMKFNFWEENKAVSSTQWTECVSKSNAVQTKLQWDLSQCLIFMNVLQYICICMGLNTGPDN